MQAKLEAVGKPIRPPAEDLVDELLPETANDKADEGEDEKSVMEDDGLTLDNAASHAPRFPGGAFASAPRKSLMDSLGFGQAAGASALASSDAPKPPTLKKAMPRTPPSANGRGSKGESPVVEALLRFAKIDETRLALEKVKFDERRKAQKRKRRQKREKQRQRQQRGSQVDENPGSTSQRRGKVRSVSSSSRSSSSSSSSSSSGSDDTVSDL